MKYILFSTLLICFESFGQTPITDTNFHAAIQNCLTTHPVDGLCSSSEYGAMPDWDVSQVTDMSYAFSGRLEFNADISAWNVGQVTDMGEMFAYTDFNQDIGSWNVSKVTDMFSMFYQTPFNQIINDWDVSKVIDMYRMFSNTPFNKNIGNWDVGLVIDMGKMFENTPFNQDIGNWNVSSVLDMNSTFYEAYLFNQDIGNWDVSQVTDMGSLFSQGYSFNQDIGAWDVGNVTNMRNMFFNDYYHPFNKNIGNWNVSNVTNMSGMFYNAINFNQDINSWDVSSVTNMSFMFNGATDFQQNIGNWDVGNVSFMQGMFGTNALVTEYYDALLNGWSSNPNLQTNVGFNAGSATYCNGVNGRAILTDTFNWNVLDGGYDCSTLGLSHAENFDLKIYPNPANELLTVAGLNSSMDLCVYDLTGKLLLKVFDTDHIDVKDLSSGIYLLKLSSGTDVLIKRFIRK
ncbi:MAG: BspA family leucine-rich repeat surface protein [Bacteroidia bacterium]|nr:BspA family leucine-rich repeat surface protein [Bacteroidia bacterium]